MSNESLLLEGLSEIGLVPLFWIAGFITIVGCLQLNCWLETRREHQRENKDM